MQQVRHDVVVRKNERPHRVALPRVAIRVRLAPIGEVRACPAKQDKIRTVSTSCKGLKTVLSLMSFYEEHVVYIRG